MLISCTEAIQRIQGTSSNADTHFESTTIAITECRLQNQCLISCTHFTLTSILSSTSIRLSSVLNTKQINNFKNFQKNQNFYIFLDYQKVLMVIMQLNHKIISKKNCLISFLEYQSLYLSLLLCIPSIRGIIENWSGIQNMTDFN